MTEELPPLVEPEQVAGFPGAPFPAALLAAAGGAIRDLCGWHIAPLVTQTVRVDSGGGRDLFLPTLRLVDVVEVRDVTGVEPRPITGWRKTAVGVLHRPGGWPAGMEAVEVEMVHGYESCPPSLLPLIVAEAQASSRNRTVRQETAGTMSVSYADGTGLSPALARYRIPVV